MRKLIYLAGAVCILIVLAACGANGPSVTQGASAGQPPTAYPVPADANSSQPSGSGQTLVDPSAYPAPGDPSVVAPQASDSTLKREDVTIDTSSSQVVVRTTTPQTAALSVLVNLPSPCHQARVKVNLPDGTNTIAVEVYSLVDTSKVCAAVVTPAEEVVSLGSLAPGSYKVTLNGQVFQSFVLK